MSHQKEQWRPGTFISRYIWWRVKKAWPCLEIHVSFELNFFRGVTRRREMVAHIFMEETQMCQRRSHRKLVGYKTSSKECWCYNGCKKFPSLAFSFPCSCSSTSSQIKLFKGWTSYKKACPACSLLCSQHMEGGEIAKIVASTMSFTKNNGRQDPRKKEGKRANLVCRSA